MRKEKAIKMITILIGMTALILTGCNKKEVEEIKVEETEESVESTTENPVSVKDIIAMKEHEGIELEVPSEALEGEDSVKYKEQVAWERLSETIDKESLDEQEVERVYQNIIERYKELATEGGYEYEDYITEVMAISVADFEKQMEEGAKEIVKQAELVDAVLKDAGLEPTKEELEKLKEEYAKQAGMTVTELDEAFKGREKELETILKQQLAKEYVGSKAIAASDRVSEENTDEQPSESTNDGEQEQSSESINDGE